jgi:hypothetical protein
MRKTVLWQAPHVRASLSALLALVAIVIVVGCGGGGGGGGGGNNGTTNGTTTNGGPPPGQNPTLPFISGRVTDTSSPAQGVPGATITLFGTGVPNINKTVTSTDGTFTIANVDPRYTAFSVLSPDTSKWYNFALYNSKQYDTVNCRLPLPALQAGNNNLSSTVALFSAGNNPPPPPPLNGCP